MFVTSQQYVVTNVPKVFGSKYQEPQADTNVCNLHGVEGRLSARRSAVCLRSRCIPMCEHQLGTQKSASRWARTLEFSFLSPHLRLHSLSVCPTPFPSDPFSRPALSRWSILFPCCPSQRFWKTKRPRIVTIMFSGKKLVKRLRAMIFL